MEAKRDIKNKGKGKGIEAPVDLAAGTSEWTAQSPLKSWDSDLVGSPIKF
jgi:hypothetical protein